MNFPIINTSYDHVNSFINEIAPLVCNEFLKRKSANEHCVMPSVVIAQACIESGYNLDADTLFGIKGSDIQLDTTEWIDGEYVNVQAGFKKFPSIAGAIEGYYDLMQWENYADATTPVANTWEEQIEGLTNENGYPYATDPDYKKNVTAVINDWGLVIFDSFVIEYEVPVEVEITEEFIQETAEAVIRGEYGDGEARKDALGDLYDVVQTRVDEILAEQAKPVEPKELTSDEIDAIANDVISGKYGNGNARKEALGKDYDVVQARVDEILKGYSEAVKKTDEIKVGSHVRFMGTTDYYGTVLKLFPNRPYYEVSRLSGEKALLSYNGGYYADVRISDCELV